MNSMLELVKHRYTAKRYDVNKPISDETLNDLLEVLCLSPSSVNIQPWHFYALKTKEALHAIRPAVKDFNLERTEHAPVIIVFAIEKHLDDAYVHRLMAQEAADGRFRGQFADPEFAAKLEAFRCASVKAYCSGADRGECWAANQCHIALGFLLLAAAGMGVDATTLGGMHFEKVDEILGLAAKGQKSVMACALGYRSSDDWNADAPKSRFPLDAVATIL